MQKWYQKTWVIIAFLILFFPVGLGLMWINKNWNKKLKIAVSGLTIILVFAVLGSDEWKSNTDKDSSNIVQADKNIIDDKTEDIIVKDDINIEQTDKNTIDDDEKNITKKNNINIDWEKCINQTKESITDKDHYPYVKDIHILVNDDENLITISIVLEDLTNPNIALEYGDTVIRQLNLYAGFQDGTIKSAGQYYYGGIYDIYDVSIGISPFSKVDRYEEWFVYDGIARGAHTKIKLRKQYR